MQLVVILSHFAKVCNTAQKLLEAKLTIRCSGLKMKILKLQCYFSICYCTTINDTCEANVGEGVPVLPFRNNINKPVGYCCLQQRDEDMLFRYLDCLVFTHMLALDSYIKTIVHTGFVFANRLLNKDGALLAYAGFDSKDARVTSAIASSIWGTYSKNAMASGDLLELVCMECEVFNNFYLLSTHWHSILKKFRNMSQFKSKMANFERFALFQVALIV